MEYLLAVALFAGLVLLPGTTAHAEDTMPSPGTIVQKEGGIVSIPSNHSVDETVDKLRSILQSKQITLFAVIDHSGEAAKVGLKMPPTKLLIFGNPKGGTPLMLAAPAPPSTFLSRFWLRRTPRERFGSRTIVRNT